MNYKCYVGCLALFIGGLALGTQVPVSGKYQEGRLSACKDLMSVMSQLSPIFMLIGPPQCVPYKGDAAISLGGKFYSLDGKTELK